MFWSKIIYYVGFLQYIYNKNLGREVEGSGVQTNVHVFGSVAPGECEKLLLMALKYLGVLMEIHQPSISHGPSLHIIL